MTSESDSEPAPKVPVAKAECLGAIVGRLSFEEDCLSGLNRLKSALMSVLLTGELRVVPGGGVA